MPEWYQIRKREFCGEGIGLVARNKTRYVQCRGWHIRFLLVPAVNMMLVVLPMPPLVLAQAMTFAIIAPSESFGQHACLRLACLLCNV